MSATRAVILAAGLGTRMRAGTAQGPPLDPEQRAAADLGLKALVPFAGRTFLEWSLAALARAGIGDVVIVIGSTTLEIRSRLPERALPVRVHFETQAEPLGSADALLAAAPALDDAPFLVLNSDNLYAPDDLRRLAALPGPGLVGYDRAGLVRGGIPAERIAAFALIEETPDGGLHDIVEKPDAATAARLGAARVSMTCWHFDLGILEACRGVVPSPRGELELPDAVRLLLRAGVRFDVIPSAAAVLDLSTRADIPIVAAALGVLP